MTACPVRASRMDNADPIAELITTYNELNSSAIIELDEELSALEFMRFVARNTPFVVRGAASGWEATQTWSARSLEEHLANETVNVAVTPAGYAILSPHPPPRYSSDPHYQQQRRLPYTPRRWPSRLRQAMGRRTALPILPQLRDPTRANQHPLPR